MSGGTLFVKDIEDSNQSVVTGISGIFIFHKYSRLEFYELVFSSTTLSF